MRVVPSQRTILLYCSYRQERPGMSRRQTDSSILQPAGGLIVSFSITAWSRNFIMISLLHRHASGAPGMVPDIELLRSWRSSAILARDSSSVRGSLLRNQLEAWGS
jgi:hypothetical protein